MDIDIDYIFKRKKFNPKTQNLNLTQKPKSKPTQPKYPKLTHKFITKSKGEKKKHGRFQKTKTIFEEGKKYTYLQNMLLQRRNGPENELGKFEASNGLSDD